MHSKILNTSLLVCLALPLLAAAPTPSVASESTPDAASRIDLGRYLVKLGGCNDCHTPGYGAAGGKVPEQDWLIGDRLGWKGPWGTTYPANLRLLVSGLSEEQWLAIAQHKEMRPPMPWFTLRAMKEEDLRAVYLFIRTLGPKGDPAPDYVPPGKIPNTPTVTFPD